MRDKDLYSAILGIRSPWRVVDVDLSTASEEVRVTIDIEADFRFACPKCDKSCGRYDSRSRSWRHLDTCQFKTLLVADVPRVKCAEHGVVQVHVPWADSRSGFTALMEALIIDWLKEASIDAVARLMRLSWAQVDGVMQRAVRRGLKRREFGSLARLCVDETSFQKRHEYVTVVTDQSSSAVLYVADGRNQAALDGFWDLLSSAQLESVQAIAMDMCRSYILSTRKRVPDAERKIAFDRFHVSRAIGVGVNTVRKQEHRELSAEGDSTLRGTRHVWLTNAENHSDAQSSTFEALRDAGLKVARAYGMKETARGLWKYKRRATAEKNWKKWITWLMRSRLEPMKRVALMVRENLWGILNAVVLNTTNALSESVNAKIQRIKNRACGFRNRKRFRDAIYFHCGKLDLYPEALSATHTTS